MRPCQASPDCLHTACKHCDDLIRTGSDKSADHPGTKMGTRRDQQCRQCLKRGGPPPPQVRHEQCVKCKIRLRGHNETLAAHPGTARLGGHGHCTSCYNKMYRNREEHKLVVRSYQRRRRKREQKQLQKEKMSETLARAFDDTDIAHLEHQEPGVYWLKVRRRIRIAKRLAHQQGDLQMLHQLAQHERTLTR